MSTGPSVSKVRVRRRRRISYAQIRQARLRRLFVGVAAGCLMVVAGFAAIKPHVDWPGRGQLSSVPHAPTQLAGDMGPKVAAAHGPATHEMTRVPRTRPAPARSGPPLTQAIASKPEPGPFVPRTLPPERTMGARFESEPRDERPVRAGIDAVSDRTARVPGSDGASEDAGAEQPDVVTLEFDAPGAPVRTAGPYFGTPRLRSMNFASLPANPFGSLAAEGGAALVVSDPLGGGGLGGSRLPAGVAPVPATTVPANAGGPAVDTTAAVPGASAAPPSSTTAPLTPLVVSDGDVFGGTVTVPGGLILEGTGLLVPGNSPGITTVNPGDLVIHGGLLQIEIEGTQPGTEYDQVIVVAPGVAMLDGGKIEFLFHPDFTPGDGDRFDFLIAEGGILENDAFGFDKVEFEVQGLDPLFSHFIDRSDTTWTLALELVATPQLLSLPQTSSSSQSGSVVAPAPATFWLLLAGVAGLRARRRA